uniref:C2H2-type domain-containing protein n=1 Tax=Rhabditophanes sp. KR3021 TaxID=114890 RepID=A0AC35TX47_9BILA
MPSKHTLQNKQRKRKNLDDDQIQENLLPEKREKLENQPFDEDLPGGGQFYCVSCDRHLASEKDRVNHKKGKSHKQKVKELAKGPAFTVKEAEMAGGLGGYEELKVEVKVVGMETSVKATK